MITLTYTQRSVAFPTLPRYDGETDSVNVSLDDSGGGTQGEFHWKFQTFNGGHLAVLLSVFGDGLPCFFDARVQQVVHRWRAMPDPDMMTPNQLCGFLREAGAVPSRYMTTD